MIAVVVISLCVTTGLFVLRARRKASAGPVIAFTAAPVPRLRLRSARKETL